MSTEHGSSTMKAVQSGGHKEPVASCLLGIVRAMRACVIQAPREGDQGSLAKRTLVGGVIGPAGVVRQELLRRGAHCQRERSGPTATCMFTRPRSASLLLRKLRK